MIIPVAHDFNCPWCWIGLHQAKRLQHQFGVEFDWLAYELSPEDMQVSFGPPQIEPPNKPPVPSRLQLAYAAEGIERPTNRGPIEMRTHKAHEAVEFTKTEGKPDDFIEALYRAHYEQAADLDDLDTLAAISKPFVQDMSGMVEAIQTKRFAANIVRFDEPAHQTGIYNVPTFIISGERYAEQPYVVLERAMKRAVALA